MPRNRLEEVESRYINISMDGKDEIGSEGQVQSSDGHDGLDLSEAKSNPRVDIQEIENDSKMSSRGPTAMADGRTNEEGPRRRLGRLAGEQVLPLLVRSVIMIPAFNRNSPKPWFSGHQK